MLKASGSFGTADEAAKDFARKYNGLSIMLGVEILSVICKGTNEDGGDYFMYCKPALGTTIHSDYSLIEDNPANTDFYGTIHTHGNFMSPENNEFSPRDLGNAMYTRSRKYMVSPNGSLWFFDGNEGRSNNNPRKLPGMFPCDALDPTSSRNNKQRYSNYMWGIPSFNDYIKHFFGE